jgi:AraC-like DNA-binding protein
VTVDEVARAAGLSRRVLERRFRREFNSSVQAEIRRVRTDRIARLLVETSLPVSDIAESLGFPDIRHFARYFRAWKQVSPMAYRRQMGWPAAAKVSQIGDIIPQSGVAQMDAAT